MPPASPRKGRGAGFNPDNRYAPTHIETVNDGWDRAEEPLPPLQTTVRAQTGRRIISRNQSPDLPFSQSINPYQGCEHGCIYCYARPSHAYLELSPGLDFETQLFAKPDAARLLREELARPGYVCSPINLGSNTDPYQPIEREWRVTRQILEVLTECRHPVTIVTKSALVERDLDLLTDLARDQLVQVLISVTTLDGDLARKLEPRANAPHRRLAAIERLSAAGVPVGSLVAPIIPGLNDAELEAILAAIAQAGGQFAAYVLLRLPREVAPLFDTWLHTHFPLRAEHVLSLIRQSRAGALNDSTFGARMRGQGVYAQLIARRFELACQRLGLNAREGRPLATHLFRPPLAAGQLDLFSPQ